MAANPSDTSRLQLEKEFREVQASLQMAKYRDKILLEHRPSARATDLSQALLDIEPQFVHFSGHGSSSGELLFEARAGKSHPVSSSAISALFELASDHVECVLLNACYSKRQADAISNYIPYVIGMDDTIGDHAAIVFAIGFYKAIGAGYPVEKAFKFGCVEMRLEGIPGHLIPCLLSSKTKFPDKTMPSTTTDQVQWVLVLSGKIDDINKTRAEAILEHLRELLDDASLNLNKIEPGSIKLFFDGSEDSFDLIQYLIQEGKLSQLLKFNVETVYPLHSERASQALPEMQESLPLVDAEQQTAFLSMPTIIQATNIYEYIRGLSDLPPQQAIHLFYQFLLEGKVPDYLQRNISTLGEVSSTELLPFVNRCYYTLANPWIMRGMDDAVAHLLLRLKNIPGSGRETSVAQNLHQALHLFRDSDYYLVLKRHLNLMDSTYAQPSNPRKFSNLFKNYFFVYAVGTQGPGSLVDIETPIGGILERKNMRLRSYCRELSKFYIRYSKSSQPDNVNPTFLSDIELYESINLYKPKRENSFCKQSEIFNTKIRTVATAHEFKEILFNYVMQPVSEFTPKFHRTFSRLFQEALNAMPNNIPLTQVSKIMVFNRLLRTVIGQDSSDSIYYMAISVGENLVTSLALKIVLACNMVRFGLEKQLTKLFTQYESYEKEQVTWLIRLFDHMNVALALNAKHIGYFNT